MLALMRLKGTETRVLSKCVCPPCVFSRYLHVPPWIARLEFVRQVKPDSGFWKGASYHFTFTIPALYPHDPPKVSNVMLVHFRMLALADAGCRKVNYARDWYASVACL